MSQKMNPNVQRKIEKKRARQERSKQRATELAIGFLDIMMMAQFSSQILLRQFGEEEAIAKGYLAPLGEKRWLVVTPDGYSMAEFLGVDDEADQAAQEMLAAMHVPVDESAAQADVG